MDDIPPPPYSTYDPASTSTSQGGAARSAIPLPTISQPASHAPSWASNSYAPSQVSNGSPRLLTKRPAVSSDVAALPQEDSLLHQLVANGNMSQVKLLLEKGGEAIEALNKKGQTPLYAAVTKNAHQIVGLLLDYGANPTTCPPGKDSCLHIACKENWAEMTKRLVESLIGDVAGAEVINKPNSKGETPLYVAVQKNHRLCAEALLDAGANAMARPQGKDAMIHLAVKHGSSELLQMLLQRGVNTEELKDGETPLYRALYRSYNVLAKLLIEHGASVTTPTSKGESPLSLAVSRGDVPIVALLLAQKNIDLDVLDLKGRSPLWVAINSSFTTIAELLLQSGVDPTSHPAKSDSCLSLAVERGNVSLVHSLLLRGADVEKKNKSGETPLFQAISRGDAAIVSLLLIKGANTNTTNKDGESALQRAVYRNDISVTILLLAHGADPNACVNGGDPVLYTAVSRSSAALASILLVNKADPSTPSKSGETPLNRAIYVTSAEIVSILLTHGVNVRARTKDGMNMLEYAQKRGDQGIVSLLQIHTNQLDARTPEKGAY